MHHQDSSKQGHTLRSFTKLEQCENKWWWKERHGKGKRRLVVRGIASSGKHGGSGFLKWSSVTRTGTTWLPFIDDVTGDRRSLVDGESLWIYTPSSQKEQNWQKRAPQRNGKLVQYSLSWSPDFNLDGGLFYRYCSIVRLSKCHCLVWISPLKEMTTLLYFCEMFHSRAAYHISYILPVLFWIHRGGVHPKCLLAGCGHRH